jgi:hypothetical protein
MYCALSDNFLGPAVSVVEIQRAAVGHLPPPLLPLQHRVQEVQAQPHHHRREGGETVSTSALCLVLKGQCHVSEIFVWGD